MNKILSCGSSSASHTYGNVSSAIKELLLSKFPEDFFNYIHISTEMQYRSNRKLNKELELYKRKKPLLLIKPTYEPADDSLFGNQTALTRSMTDISSGISNNSISPFIYEKNSGATLAYRLNRDKITFDITVRLETLGQQLDVYKNIQNLITWDRTYSIGTSLESMIPRSMMVSMSKFMDIDITNKDNIPSFLNMIQMVSDFPITYKIRNSSGSDEFFLYYTHGMFITFTDLSIDEGERRNMAEDNFNITFRVTAEFNFPGMYILSCNHNFNYDFRIDAKVTMGSSSDIVPLFTLTNLFNEEYLTSDGYRNYTSFVCNTDKENDEKPDTVDMSDTIDNDVRHVILDQMGKGLASDMCIKAVVVENAKKLTYGTDYTINWDNFTLTILNSNYRATYRVILYLNLKYVNDVIMDLSRDDLTYDSISK